MNTSAPKITIPAFIASPLPFRLIKRSTNDNWNPDIDDINKFTYDYVRLHRVSGTIDIGLPKPYTMAVTFDGSFILPAIKKYSDITTAVDEFNNFFGSLLLGGVFTQAVDATFLQRCFVHKNYYFETVHQPLNSFVELKNNFRHKHASVKDNIILMDCESILLHDISIAYLAGRAILQKVTNLSPSFLIKGMSTYINNSFAESLVNNWLSVEQILDNIWQKKVVQDQSPGTIKGRQDFLKDNRTWTTAAKTELFFQKGLINERLYNQISKARKARNNFVHTGTNPSKEEAETAFSLLFFLLSLVVSDFKEQNIFDKLLLKYKKIDPIKRNFYDKKPSSFKIEAVSYWLNAPIPPIPGSNNWDEQLYPYDIGFDFDNQGDTR
ncbi:hypothetical protein [Pseudoflavitalea rhizosphaerae]|uniref:hypothetical protein n=1 Tax=Pseudoflavitalea rhizosphaerae TaxID=1884793 RepID=UPI000F8D63AF|nr:hypothetical protein [Pseudoflavitalea rhizosphaerae]